MEFVQRIDETLHPDAGFFFMGSRLIEKGQTDFQSYEVWESPLLGKFFRLDDCFMTSENDEFFYHENLIQLAAVSHSAPQSALVIGGGDGGSAEELLKHPSMQRVVLVELDAEVVRIARRHFASIHRGVFDDPRLELHIADGLDYVRNTAPSQGQRFDLIVLDLTDPVGPAAELYSQSFFADCQALLAPGGALTLHTGAPFYHPHRVRILNETLLGVFQHVRPFFVHVPLYGALWGMACASDTLDPADLSAAEVDARIAARKLAPLQYYNGATHQALLALPNYLRTLLGR